MPTRIEFDLGSINREPPLTATMEQDQLAKRLDTAEMVRFRAERAGSNSGFGAGRWNVFVNDMKVGELASLSLRDEGRIVAVVESD